MPCQPPTLAAAIHGEFHRMTQCGKVVTEGKRDSPRIMRTTDFLPMVR
jgi:hypothetical protein